MVKTCLLPISILFGLFFSSCGGPQDGTYSFEILSTNDLHGTFFDSTYVGKRIKKSLYAVKWTVDSVRTAAGREHVILLDGGDILQGDNAAYYFNYVDTLSPHVFPRMAAYLSYDAVTVGNHDIETGHSVYDRVAKELNAEGIPFLAGNAFRTDNGKTYFPGWKLIKRKGIRILVLGYTNPNVKNWLAENLWSGMTFQSLLPLVQQDVDRLRARLKPHLVIVSVHSGTGEGDGKSLENQGMDLYRTLRGVDFLFCAHDHQPVVFRSDTLCLINAGSHCRFVGHGAICLTFRRGEVLERRLKAGLIPVDDARIDTTMAAKFHADYRAVRTFTTTPVGELKTELRTRDAYAGMCDYINLIHSLSLSCAPARLSIAAPLTYDGTVKPGTVLYNDLFTIYPFENQLYVVEMTGSEVKRYLEISYEDWIRTYPNPEGRILKIQPYTNRMTGRKGWSFVNRSYNFDSVGGLVYTVDVTKPFGERVRIASLAGGKPFFPEANYPVAMTSYRASGGGGLLKKAGVDTDKIEERVLVAYPEIRDLLYDYIKARGAIDHREIGDTTKIGRWSFEPASIAEPALEKDLKLLFGDY